MKESTMTIIKEFIRFVKSLTDYHQALKKCLFPVTYGEGEAAPPIAI